ncbi:Hypothetical predicted protein [Mytilus galloprovincialis]|uniref:Ig-like domain-containing protein n=1 Tax=Mytilus galloprovincialis TaxID=29158 RepID=A0A8B6CSL8_MYTGA|nr:Hypothetical predicted protein [Mytilus galloprovincialis]
MIGCVENVVAAAIKQAIDLLAQMIGYVRHVGNLVIQQNTAMQTLILLVKIANLNQNQIQTFPTIQKAVTIPHVTSILLTSKLQLPVKRKENEFMILNGDNVKIVCYVNSYIPVRSVTWLKERNGEIIQITSAMETYVMVSGKSPSLIIYNFNAEDQGKYRCIVRNVVGLRTEMFVSCRNLMSRVGWWTGFVTVLQHIPVFHTGDITLHTYDIDSQSKSTVYNVYKGDDITMEQCCDDQQKCIAVKWFKESDTLAELDMSNEQYSGGVLEVPSLTIKSTTIGNAGKYISLLIFDNGKTKTSSFRMKIIPQVKIYKALCEHREDRTFIRPVVCDAIDKIMQENKIVVITGREGTGKSKICLELASCYDEKDYMVLKVDLSKNHSIYTDISNVLLIIDDQQYTQDSLNTFMKDLVSVLPERNIQVVLTCMNLDLKIVRNVPEINELKSETFMDINSCLTPEEKEQILRRYMKENNIEVSSSAESNFKDPNILTDLSVLVTLDEDVIKAIRNEEPWKGFPLCASLFCSERKFLHLGKKYFTNPPRQVFEELKVLYKTAKKKSNSLDTVNEYCILVYILENSNHQLDLNDPNLCRKLVEKYKILFQFKYIPEKPGSNEDQKIAIEKALHRMTNKYLKLHEGKYQFIHPCLSKAMFLSSDSMVDYLLQNGSLHDITEFVRSEVYTALENELIIKIGQEYHHILCERLVRHAFEDHSLLQHIAQYIYPYWRLSGNNLVNMMFKHIEFILFKSLEVHTGDSLSLGNESVSENIINLGRPLRFVNVILLVDELTFKGRDPWIYGPGTSDFLILSALVSAAMGKYATNRDQTFNILLKEFQNRINLESFVKLLSKPLDINGNTFFHYLMLFSEKEASDIMNVSEDRKKYKLDTENVEKYTPLDIASFLGRKHILEELNLRTNFTKQLRDRLKRLAKSGNDEYYDENQKNKNIYQPMVHKTKDDSASPDKRGGEDADDEKNGIKDRFSFLKRTSSIRKEKPSKKEKHDINDVLCFEDIVIHTVVMGKKEDYQSIIELLS